MNEGFSKIDSGDDWSTLKIDRVNKQQSGNYSCTVISDSGVDSQVLKLLIKGLFKIRVFP